MWRSKKEEMIELQLKKRDIRDPKVIQAMWEIDRAKFVPEEKLDEAYEDYPLPIGNGQTISQPYIVAYMAQALKPQPDQIVLEVGTGCGYNAAVLSKLFKQVYSLEIIDWLVEIANKNLFNADIKNVIHRQADGYKGWPEKGPFDAIILTAAPPEIPEPLKQQLKIGGKLLAPVGEDVQHLILLHKTGENSFEKKNLLPVRFVPMTGEAQNIS